MKPKLSQLRRIACRVWDPIRLQSDDPSGDDEFDSYLVHVANLVAAGGRDAEAVDYLIQIEAQHMGLGVSETTRERAETAVGAVRVYLDRLAKPVRRLEVDASGWKTEDELWWAILASLGAPAGHGPNYAALWETVTEAAAFGLTKDETTNKVQPPFEIVVKNSGSLDRRLASRLHGIAKELADAKAEYDMEVGLSLE